MFLNVCRVLTTARLFLNTAGSSTLRLTNCKRALLQKRACDSLAAWSFTLLLNCKQNLHLKRLRRAIATRTFNLHIAVTSDKSKAHPRMPVT
jgi:hypothetical protein